MYRVQGTRCKSAIVGKRPFCSFLFLFLTDPKIKNPRIAPRFLLWFYLDRYGNMVFVDKKKGYILSITLTKMAVVSKKEGR